MSASIKQYRTAFDLSQVLADTIKVSKYPIDIFEVFKHKKGPPILVSSFSDYKSWANSAGRKCQDEVKDAKCYFDPGTGVYIIVYNEKKSKKRIRFSLAHELAHIVLDHLNDERTEIDRGGLDDITYYAMEGAANTFAGNFLAPPILIHERLSGSHFDIYDIARFFDLSNESVRDYRKRDYQYWLSMPHRQCEKRILERCKSKMFPHFCYNCSSVSYGKGFMFCPICGDQSLSNYESEDFAMAKYSGIDTDESKRALECPVCHNTELIDNGTFCMICGSSIVNTCGEEFPPNRTAFCGTSLPGNARFCPFCGSPTTFFNKGFLDAWDYEPPNDNVQKYVDDGELPF